MSHAHPPASSPTSDRPSAAPATGAIAGTGAGGSRWDHMINKSQRDEDAGKEKAHVIGIVVAVMGVIVAVIVGLMGIF